MFEGSIRRLDKLLSDSLEEQLLRTWAKGRSRNILVLVGKRSSFVLRLRSKVHQTLTKRPFYVCADGMFESQVHGMFVASFPARAPSILGGNVGGQSPVSEFFHGQLVSMQSGNVPFGEGF